jgi:uncharacterized membrane protein
MEAMEAIKYLEEFVAAVPEIMGVGVIALAFLYGSVRGVLHFTQRKADAYERVKTYIGKALQLGLEFLVASDVIRTVTMDPTREGMLNLGLLILVRTLLSWSITVEIEGCWPWQLAKNKKE